MIKAKFKQIIGDLKNVSIVKNLWILTSGTGISQIFPIISAPIVARLYDPEHFGIYAVFYSLASLFTGLAFLDYNNIIVVAPNNQKAYEGMILSGIVNALINFVLLMSVSIIPKALLITFFGKEVYPYLWIVPITVFINCVSQLYYTWFLRKGKYRLLSRNKIILSICAVILQISIGYLRIGALGFIIANLGSIIFSLALFVYSFNKDKDFIPQKVTFYSLKELAIEYRKFSLVSVWGNTLNIFTMQIPQFLLNKVFGAQILGQYSLAQRMISLPLGFISAAVQDVFKQGASNENNDFGHCKSTYMSTLKIVSVIGAIVLLLCLTFVPSLFVFVFGSKWESAGVYVKVLSFLFVVRFIVAPLSYVLYIKAKQHWDFLWQIGLFVMSVLTLYGGYNWLEVRNPLDLLLLYSIALTLWYLLNLKITYDLAKKTDSITT
jgi:O-antigen/teichoic acid export membrane protein